LNENFDEIICYETLEHIRSDDRLCALFFKILKPGGWLHLCCPYAKHFKWMNEPLDLEEKWGGHVRAGYTSESYRSLLEPIGFKITANEGMGGKLLTRSSLAVQYMQTNFGNMMALPVSILLSPFVSTDPTDVECPYSIYVRAEKPG
jgi:hypothetical protein